MMGTAVMDKTAEIQEWKDKAFLPWKAAMAKYLDQREQQMAKLKQSAAELQTIVAMLIDGRARQAMMAWNTLGLQPRLKDLRVSGDGESLSLVAVDGKVTVLMLDDLISDLQQLLDT